jgi:hypothetical protein
LDWWVLLRRWWMISKISWWLYFSWCWISVRRIYVGVDRSHSPQDLAYR